MEESNRSAPQSGGVAAVADMIIFNGHRYRWISLETYPPYHRKGGIPASHLQEIGTATRLPGYPRDHSSADSASPPSVQVASIDGVSPEVAIAGLPRGNIYLREGAAVPPILTSAPWVQ
jgi:hypothetical protein